MIPFSCPDCGDSYSVNDALDGGTIKCRTCNKPSGVARPTPQLTLRCPNCATCVLVGEERAGLQVKCPGCKGFVRVPPRAKFQAQGQSSQVIAAIPAWLLAADVKPKSVQLPEVKTTGLNSNPNPRRKPKWVRYVTAFTILALVTGVVMLGMRSDNAPKFAVSQSPIPKAESQPGEIQARPPEPVSEQDKFLAKDAIDKARREEAQRKEEKARREEEDRAWRERAEKFYKESFARGRIRQEEEEARAAARVEALKKTVYINTIQEMLDVHEKSMTAT